MATAIDTVIIRNKLNEFTPAGIKRLRAAALAAAKVGVKGSEHRVRNDSVTYVRTATTVVRVEGGPGGGRISERVVWRI